MTRRPGDTEPEPPGGRAAERLREFIEQRFPDGIPYSPLPEDASEEEAGADVSVEQDANGDAESGTEQSKADAGQEAEAEPPGDGSAETPDEFTEQWHEDELPPNPLLEDTLPEEDKESDASAEQGADNARQDAQHDTKQSEA